MKATGRGALAIVLHTHMPYVEGFGTWPFGEEWLWEAIATSYVPLLDVLDAAPGRITLSVTPVLADQLAAPGALERGLAFLRDIRPASHALDRAEAPALAAQIGRSEAAYAATADAFERRGDLLAALAPHVSWTSAATHPLLPLLATDAGVHLQLATGVAAHHARFGQWRGGLWLPECAYAPWLDEGLEQAGVHATCVELTDVVGGEPRHLRPLRTPAGPVLVPIDRHLIDLVWGADGYPSRGAYADTGRLTPRRHRVWAVDGAPYDEPRALAQARADARDFAAEARERTRDGALAVCALDTELLGHHWSEGVAWLAAVIEACEAAGVELLALDDALAGGRGGAPVPAPEDLPPTSWGQPRTLATWSAPAAGGLAWHQRDAELRALGQDCSDAALRELLALQASDWAFLISRDSAGAYPRERFDGHLAAFDAALADPAVAATTRALAPRLARWALATP